VGPDCPLCAQPGGQLARAVPGQLDPAVEAGGKLRIVEQRQIVARQRCRHDPAEQLAVELPVQVGADHLLRAGRQFGDDQDCGDGDQAGHRPVPGRTGQAASRDRRDEAGEGADENREDGGKRATENGEHGQGRGAAGKCREQGSQRGAPAGSPR